MATRMSIDSRHGAYGAPERAVYTARAERRPGPLGAAAGWRIFCETAAAAFSPRAVVDENCARGPSPARVR